MIAAEVVTLHDHTARYILEGQKFVSKALVYFLRMLPSLDNVNYQYYVAFTTHREYHYIYLRVKLLLYTNLLTSDSRWMFANISS